MEIKTLKAKVNVFVKDFNAIVEERNKVADYAEKLKIRQLQLNAVIKTLREIIDEETTKEEAVESDTPVTEEL